MAAAHVLAILATVACGGGEMPTEPRQEPPAPVAARRIEWIDGPAGRLRIDDGGEGGIPVLFVHGLAGDRTAWQNQLARVRASRRAIAIDLRGHGESAPASNGTYTIPGFVSDIVAVSKALGLDRFVIVGHSLGASIAAGFAGAAPERVAGLLLVDPSGDGTRIPRGEAEAVLRQLAPATYPRFVRRYYSVLLEGADPEVRTHVLRTLRLTRREVVVEAFRGSLVWNPVPSVESFAGPKLAVLAQRSRAPWSLPVLLPALEARVVGPASHWPMMDRPEEFNRILIEFLESCEELGPPVERSSAGGAPSGARPGESAPGSASETESPSRDRSPNYNGGR